MASSQTSPLECTAVLTTAWNRHAHTPSKLLSSQKTHSCGRLVGSTACNPDVFLTQQARINSMNHPQPLSASTQRHPHVRAAPDTSNRDGQRCEFGRPVGRFQLFANSVSQLHVYSLVVGLKSRGGCYHQQGAQNDPAGRHSSAFWTYLS